MFSRTVVLGLILVGAVPAVAARAQSSTATLSGTVVDRNDAALPGTNITAMNVETGQRREVVSTSDGTFTIPLLPPGRYTVTAVLQGFAPTQISDIVLNVNDQRTLQIQLQVGQLEETVVVRAEAAQVDTRAGTLKEVVAQERIVGLPLNGRNALQLQRLVPGAGGVVAPGQGQNESLSINGSRPNSNNYTLDGGDNHDPFFNTPSVFPNPDALQEFTIQTSAYSAAYGRNAGAVINAVTRSGTNNFHASLFEFRRDEKLNSRSLFATENPPFKRDQFGGSFGGPIRRNQTFFFTAYQGWRESSAPGVITAIVPTAAQRAGDLSAFATPIIDPVTRTAFPGNVIPANRLNQAVQQFLATFVPLPNGPAGLLATASGQEFDQDQIVTKIDHQWTGSNRFTSRILYNQDRRREAAGDIPGFFADTDYTNWNVTLSDTHIFSPRVLNVVRFTYNRVDREQLSVVPGNKTYIDFGLAVTRPFADDVPAGIHTQVDGFFNAFSRFPLNQFRHYYQFGNEVNATFGSHQLRVGGEVSRSVLDRAEFFRGDPFLRFRNNFTGNALADLLLGRPSTFEQQAKTESNIRAMEIGVYGQDDWKVSRRLTLNLGLRWDPYFPFEDTQDRFGQFLPGVQSTVFPTAPVGAVFPGDPGVPRATIGRRLANFAPRVGFAYDPFGAGRTSVRGGYGVFHSQIRQQANNGINLAQPFSLRLTITNPPQGLDNPYASTGNPFPFTPPSGAAAQTYEFARPITLSHFHPDFRNAVVRQWNVNVQREVSAGYVTTVAYVGSRGDHLFMSYQANPARPGAGSVDSRRIYAPAFGPITTFASLGESTYHALQLSLSKRLTHGFTVLASYTRSKAIDTASSDGDGGSNPFDLSADEGISDLDIPHVFVASFVYELPKLQTAPRALRHIFGSWQTTGIVLLRSGTPFSVVAGRDNSQSGVNLDRADLVGDPDLPGDRNRDDVLDRYFDTAAFAQNAAGTFGNSGRNILRGPGFANVDFGLFKDFRGLKGSHKIQFRSEVFNLFNRQNLANPDANLSSPSFGRITNTVGDPRVIQLALKYVF
jgi:outer membrane receptor protein involved in Fe transport